MSKRVCILPCMEFVNDRYFLYAVDSVVNDVDLLIFSVNQRSWGNSDIVLTNENKQWIENFVKTNPKFNLFLGNWDQEHEQHNANIDYALSLGADTILCTASDQVYGEGDVKKMLDTLENSDADVLRVQWHTFWKLDPLCLIWPPEPWNPVLAFKPKKFRYLGTSEGKGVDENGKIVDPKTIVLSINDVKVYHFSFAHDDEFIKHKMEMSTHRTQYIPGWYEAVWKNWNPSMRDIHPAWSKMWQSAQPFPLEHLPPKIRGYFKMLQEKKRWMGTL